MMPLNHTCNYFPNFKTSMNILVLEYYFTESIPLKRFDIVQILQLFLYLLADDH